VTGPELAAPRLAPFPFAALDAFTAEEARAERAVRAHLGRGLSMDRVHEALAELGLTAGGARPEVLLRRVRRTERPRAQDDFVGVALAHGEDGALAASVLLEVEGALAAAVARRAL
jgi:hypothetical protein